MSDIVPPTTPELTPDRVRELINREGGILADVVSFIESGMYAARIRPENGDMLIRMAEKNHDAAVRLLRELLGETDG